jgi:hypothetical protein
MTNGDVDAVQVDNAGVSQEWTFAPSFTLLRECAIETADGTGAGSHSHEGLSDLSHLARVEQGTLDQQALWETSCDPTLTAE